MNMNPEKLKILKNKIRNLSGQSGCYLWKNMEDEVIYVGKALDLSDRVSSYLSSSITDLKTLSLQKEISDLDWIITGSEEEALILEATLIKKYSPKYNIRLKDDKKYPYLCISVNEKFPMIYLTRNVKSDGKKILRTFYGSEVCQGSAESRPQNISHPKNSSDSPAEKTRKTLSEFSHQKMSRTLHRKCA